MNHKLPCFDNLSDPVIVYLDVFCAYMKHRFVGQMDRAKVVTVQYRSALVFIPKLHHHVSQPDQLLTSLRDGSIFGLRGRQGHRGLKPASPQYCSSGQREHVPGRRPSRVFITRRVCITMQLWALLTFHA